MSIHADAYALFFIFVVTWRSTIILFVIVLLVFFLFISIYVSVAVSPILFLICVCLFRLIASPKAASFSFFFSFIRP